jgi:hypothetical protein
VSRRARVWLVERAGPVPPSLQAAMERAADAARGDRVGADSLPEILADATMRALRDAVRLGADREGALPLLAADALVTFACEAAAEAGVDTEAVLDRVCAAFAPALLDDLLPGEAR